MARRTTTALITAALTTLTAVALTAAGPAAGAAAAGRSASPEPVSSSTYVGYCSGAFHRLDYSGTSAKPVKRVHAPASVSRPVGLRLGRRMELYGVMNDRAHTSSGAVALAYQTLAGPTGFSCSGLGISQDDVSWASFRAPRGGPHSITATFNAGQEVFPAMCAYLAGAHRPAAARAWARAYGESLRQCRQWTNDAPLSATLRPVAVTSKRGGPIVVVIDAPVGSQYAGPALNSWGKSLPQPRTTTETVSVAILSYTSNKTFTIPQTLDCSLPAGQRNLCASAVAVFADEALQGSYHWSARGAARAARKIATAIG